VAADFFQRQETARRNTARLVVLFALAVLAIMVSIDLLLAATFGYLGRDARTGAIDWTLAADPQLVSLAVVGTLAVVGGGSLFKIAQLRGGGRVVAEQLGGRLLNPDSAVASEQRLLNVVEEMAIASGMPAPPVYLLDQEAGINAFAAGFTPNDAVIGVTRGTTEQLTRDELQGVIAHEFSHILNGDMRLNIRLIGLLHGILIIGMLGYFLLRTTLYSGYSRRRSRQEGGALPILALGAGLMAVGFFGTFFGNLIKAAVSRQREFLADAAAVQFTRQPEGIAGALKKIAGLAAGSTIQNPNAPEASHLFFGRATGGLSGLFSTHPPLAERIRRLDPSWDGTVPTVAASGDAGRPRAAGVSALAGPVPAAAGAAAAVSDAVDHVGQPQQEHLRYAATLLDSLPAPLVSAARESYGARGLVYALLFDREADPRRRQLAHLAANADPDVYQETLRMMPLVDRLHVRARLPLVEISLPALRGLRHSEYERFKRIVTALIEVDQSVDLFEWSLHRILLHDLGAHFAPVRPPRVRHHTLASVRQQAAILVSMLAYVGNRDAASARRAFEDGWRSLDLPAVDLLPVARLGVGSLDRALTALAEAAPQVKRRILRAAVASIAADRAITAGEAELLRAMSASLDCPMPPLLLT
jgi:Zn-dependent protease with chaperone function